MKRCQSCNPISAGHNKGNVRPIHGRARPPLLLAQGGDINLGHGVIGQDVYGYAWVLSADLLQAQAGVGAFEPAHVQGDGIGHICAIASRSSLV